MSGLEVVSSERHPNPGGRPFVAAVVDDPSRGETNLVIMFDEPGACAVLSLDRLLETEGVLRTDHPHRGARYEAELRDLLEGDLG